MFEDIITEKTESFVKYDFKNGTIIVDFDDKRIICKDKFTREDFKKACEVIYNDLGDQSPITPTDDGKWYKLNDGFVSCYRDFRWAVVPDKFSSFTKFRFSE